MPMSHASPARVPNFSYDTGARDLTLLDSAVQRDMARTKRIADTGARAKPYAVESGAANANAQTLRVCRRVLPQKPSASDCPRHTATKRTNHLQNAPSSAPEAKGRFASRVNEDSDPFCSRGGSRRGAGASAPSRVAGSKVNESSNIFGPPVAAFKRAPPPRTQDFQQTHHSGHIRPTLPGQTDACKFNDHIGSKFY